MSFSPIRAKIVSPVSQILVVNDISKTVLFYTSILGFDDASSNPQSAELVSGPARIVLHSKEDSLDDSGPLRPAGKAMLFFEVDAVDEMYNALKERGANPSEPEKVNWIKLHLFSVYDPDGHMLWFGKSFHQEYFESHTVAGNGQLRRALPELPFSNVSDAVAYYKDVLGFKVNYQQGDLGVMDRDKITVLLIARTEQHKGIGSCEFYIKDADELYQELSVKGANLQGKPVSYPWGLRAFQLLDCEGNRLTFAQTFE